MTFADLFVEVGRVLPKGSYSIEVTAWCHRHAAGDAETTLMWSIWDARASLHYEGKTPEIALARLKGEQLPSDYAALHTVVMS